jgi:hypothetical protein
MLIKRGLGITLIYVRITDPNKVEEEMLSISNPVRAEIVCFEN